MSQHPPDGLMCQDCCYKIRCLEVESRSNHNGLGAFLSKMRYEKGKRNPSSNIESTETGEQHTHDAISPLFAEWFDSKKYIPGDYGAVHRFVQWAEQRHA